MKKIFHSLIFCFLCNYSSISKSMEAMLQQLLTCQANFQEQYYGKQKNAAELQQNIRETIAAIKNPVKSTSTKTTTPDVSSQFQQILQDKGIWPLLQQIDGTCPLRQFIELVEEYLHAPESIPVFRQAYSAMLKHEFLREVELFAQRIESELLRAHILCGKQALERKQIPYKDVLHKTLAPNQPILLLAIYMETLKY